MKLFARQCPGSILGRYSALSPVSPSFEWNHFVDRSELFPPQLFRHRDIVTAKQNIESTYVLYFPEEHDSGSPEELCFLVPAFVQQFRKIPLQGRENNLQCDRHGGKPIRAIRWSGQGAAAQ
jgi:hypothetical protein